MESYLKLNPLTINVSLFPHPTRSYSHCIVRISNVFRVFDGSFSVSPVEDCSLDSRKLVFL